MGGSGGGDWAREGDDGQGGYIPFQEAYMSLQHKSGGGERGGGGRHVRGIVRGQPRGRIFAA